MTFREEEEIGIEFLCHSKNFWAKRFLRDVVDKGWTLGGLRAS